MATSEIEKLERRYAENPQGLTFAPLAEVHRKNGDLARALELLTAGLELHPNYIPASIVLGRCHQDSGDLESAEAAFTHVLRLDDENVIALKSLADISERLERYEEAEGWLQRLVSVDRSNEEAREQLGRVEAARQTATAKGERLEEPSQEQSDAGLAVPPAVLEMIDLSSDQGDAAEEPEAAPELLPVDLAALEPTEERSVPVAEISAPEDESTEEPLPGFVSISESETQQASAQFASAAGSDASAEAPPLEKPSIASAGAQPEEREATTPLPGLISAEFQPPLESTGGLGVETSDEVVLEVSGNSEFQVPDAAEDLKSVAARLQPPAAEIRERDSGLQHLAKTAPEPEAPIGSSMSPAESNTHPEPARQYSARDTNGQSVAAFFRAMLVARPPDTGEKNPASESAAAASSRNGATVGSAQTEEGLPVPPAVPSGEERADAAVSFDDFFSSGSEGSSPLRHGKTDPGNDDLDQFQSWLQNLKR